MAGRNKRVDGGALSISLIPAEAHNVVAAQRNPSFMQGTHGAKVVKDPVGGLCLLTNYGSTTHWPTSGRGCTLTIK